MLAGTAFGTFAVTYAHIVAFGVAHGQTGWTAMIYPFFIDGFEVIVTVYIFDRRRRGLPASAMAWTFLVVIVAVSVAVNWASITVPPPGSRRGSAGETHVDLASQLFAALPAIALLGEIKIMAQMLEPEATRAYGGAPGTSRVVSRVDRRRRPAAEVDRPWRRFTGAFTESSTTAFDTRATVGRQVDPVLRALLPFAVQAADQLADSGQKLTRETLARQLRSDGQPVSNARACDLLRLLTTPPSPSFLASITAMTHRLLLGRREHPPAVPPITKPTPEPESVSAREPRSPSPTTDGPPVPELTTEQAIQSAIESIPEAVAGPTQQSIPQSIPQPRSGGWSS